MKKMTTKTLLCPVILLMSCFISVSVSSSSSWPGDTDDSLVKLPHQRVFFSISDQIEALKQIFQNVINLERDLLWKPTMPSRMSRGFLLVKLFSNLLNIMPFPEVLKDKAMSFNRFVSFFLLLSCISCHT